MSDSTAKLKAELQKELQEELKQLQENYLKLSGGKTQCVIGKEGEPSIDIKQAEGAMQAVSDVLRCINKLSPNQAHGDLINQELNDCIDKVTEQWSRLSEISETWVAYKRSGLRQVEKYRPK